MKFRTLIYPFFVLLALGFASCTGGKKAEPAKIADLQMFTDKSMSFGIKYPANWIVRNNEGKDAFFYSGNDAIDRFVKFDAEGVSGAKMSISAQKAKGETLESVMEQSKIVEASMYSAPENATIAGTAGKKLTCQFDLQDGKYHSEKYFVMKDSIITIIGFEAFGGTFDALKPKFDEMLAAVVLGAEMKVEKKDASQLVAEVFKPSETMTNYKGDGFSLQIPDNFTGSPIKGNNTLFSVQFTGIGGPKDCAIRVDVLDASKNKNLDKIVAQNKATYKADAASNSSLGGEKAAFINYSFAKNVKSRVYFAVKGDRLYRVTMNWFQPEEAIFLPSFEKVIASWKF